MSKTSIGVISLGCSKNRVDTELMLGALRDKNVGLVADPAEADIIIINTCGFIESAKQESIDTILEMAAYKKHGRLKGLIVAGCLSGRYKQELVSELPEVDAFLGVNAYDRIDEVLEAIAAGGKCSFFDAPKVEGAYADRLLTTPFYSAYVKVAEGCDNRCTYCAIPSIRGGLLSRRMEDIQSEVETLIQRGVKEVVLVAQDTTVYGRDIYGQGMLPELIRRLASLPGLKWLRVLYSYPENINEELLDTMMHFDSVVKYLDIPIQHLDDRVLRRMNRRNSRQSIYEVVETIRHKSPEFVIRTTLIAGFPGESEAEFAVLRQGVSDLRFDRLGAFAYSREEGTPAADFSGQLPAAVREQRREELMEIQQAVSLELNRRRIGRTYEVLIEGPAEQEGLYRARSYAEAPEIDGSILVRSGTTLQTGRFYEAVITDAGEYDLMGELV